MGWRLAESLKVLRAEINERFPNRSKAADGTIGDAAHSQRASDHNPNPDGVVCAIDITHDPANGVDGSHIAARACRDARTKYVIWNRRIWSKARASEGWRPYSGANAHTKHVHISVGPGASLYDSKKTWGFGLPAPAPEEECCMCKPECQDEIVRKLLEKLDLPKDRMTLGARLDRLQRSIRAVGAGQGTTTE